MSNYDLYERLVNNPALISNLLGNINNAMETLKNGLEASNKDFYINDAIEDIGKALLCIEDIKMQTINPIKD